jgi:hypothetical protein
VRAVDLHAVEPACAARDAGRKRAPERREYLYRHRLSVFFPERGSATPDGVNCPPSTPDDRLISAIPDLRDCESSA